MKKLFLPLFAGGLLMASCNNNEMPVYNQSVQTATLYIPASGTPTVSEQMYNFSFNLGYYQATLSASDILTPDGSYIKFETNPVNFYYSVALQGAIYYMEDAKGISQTGYSPVTINEAVLFSNYYTYPTNLINLPTTAMVSVTGSIGGDSFVTFPLNCFYKGNTIATITATGSTYQNEDIYYGVSIDIDNNTAKMVIMDAKFAEPAPKISFILEDLIVTWTSTGYTISGTNVVPLVLEGAGTTPNPNYTFDTIKLTFRDSILSMADIAFTIADNKYSAIFSGSYIVPMEYPEDNT